MNVLKSWVEAFTSAGIRLVFFFDGVVKEQKRQEWVRKKIIIPFYFSIFLQTAYLNCFNSTHLRNAPVERLSLNICPKLQFMYRLVSSVL